MNEDDQVMMNIDVIFYIAKRSKELGRLARKKSKKICKECGTILKRMYIDKRYNTLFCPNKKCKKFLGSV